MRKLRLRVRVWAFVKSQWYSFRSFSSTCRRHVVARMAWVLIHHNRDCELMISESLSRHEGNMPFSSRDDPSTTASHWLRKHIPDFSHRHSAVTERQPGSSSLCKTEVTCAFEQGRGGAPNFTLESGVDVRSLSADDCSACEMFLETVSFCRLNVPKIGRLRLAEPSHKPKSLPMLAKGERENRPDNKKDAVDTP